MKVNRWLVTDVVKEREYQITPKSLGHLVRTRGQWQMAHTNNFWPSRRLARAEIRRRMGEWANVPHIGRHFKVQGVLSKEVAWGWVELRQATRGEFSHIFEELRVGRDITVNTVRVERVI